MKPTYYIDGDNNATYGTLDDIRRHVWMQSENDRKAYDGMYIVRANKNDEPKAESKRFFESIAFAETVCAPCLFTWLFGREKRSRKRFGFPMRTQTEKAIDF